MELNLISIETVKAQLDISTLDYDAKITALIPIVSADVRRILNNKYDRTFSAAYEIGESGLESLYGIPMGTVVSGEGIPSDTYITQFDYSTLVYEMSANATISGTSINPTINISQWPTISKMIFYRMNNMTISNASQDNVISKSIGGVSVSYGNSQINKRWNYPQLLIDDLGIPFSEVG